MTLIKDFCVSIEEKYTFFGIYGLRKCYNKDNLTDLITEFILCITSQIQNFLNSPRAAARTRWPSDLMRRPVAVSILGLRVRIPLKSRAFVFCVLYCTKEQSRTKNVRKLKEENSKGGKKNWAKIYRLFAALKRYHFWHNFNYSSWHNFFLSFVSS